MLRQMCPKDIARAIKGALVIMGGIGPDFEISAVHTGEDDNGKATMRLTTGPQDNYQVFDITVTDAA